VFRFIGYLGGNQSLRPNVNSPQVGRRHTTLAFQFCPAVTFTVSISVYSVESLVLIDSRQKYLSGASWLLGRIGSGANWL